MHSKIEIEDCDFELDWNPSTAPKFFRVKLADASSKLSPGVMLEMTLGALAQQLGNPTLCSLRMHPLLRADEPCSLQVHLGANGAVRLAQRRASDESDSGTVAMVGRVSSTWGSSSLGF